MTGTVIVQILLWILTAGSGDHAGTTDKTVNQECQFVGIRTKHAECIIGTRGISRIDAALVLIQEGRHPIEAIPARQTGFGDGERMRRAFVRAFGEPPRAMRRNARIKTEPRQAHETLS